jgi:hypothetical protein
MYFEANVDCLKSKHCCLLNIVWIFFKIIVVMLSSFAKQVEAHHCKNYLFSQ